MRLAKLIDELKAAISTPSHFNSHWVKWDEGFEKLTEKLLFEAAEFEVDFSIDEAPACKFTNFINLPMPVCCFKLDPIPMRDYCQVDYQATYALVACGDWQGWQESELLDKWESDNFLFKDSRFIGIIIKQHFPQDLHNPVPATLFDPIPYFFSVQYSPDRSDRKVVFFRPEELEDQEAPGGYDEAEEEVISKAIDQLERVLAIANCINVEIKKIVPSEKINRSRKTKGKTPLNTYRVICLPKKTRYYKEEKTSNLLVGVGFGVRSHWRIGHLREIKKDTLIWVSPSFVHGHRKGFAGKGFKVKMQ